MKQRFCPSYKEHQIPLVHPTAQQFADFRREEVRFCSERGIPFSEPDLEAYSFAMHARKGARAYWNAVQ